jgi:uncharacterized protein (TIGR03437 family)
VSKAWLLLAVLPFCPARGAAPAYSAESIVNGANFAPGPVAPNSIVTIFGSELSWYTEGLGGQLDPGILPISLGNSGVIVANFASPLIYVCPTQINFIVPADLKPGDVKVRVVRQGVTGPEVTIKLVDVAPQLFQSPAGYVIAQHGKDYSLVTSESPAKPGEIIVIYATGLGLTQPRPLAREIPKYPAIMSRYNDLKLYLGGAAVSADRVFYAGLTPGSGGVYQLNVRLPDTLDQDPEIRAAVDDHISRPGVKLAVAATDTQLSEAGQR